MNTTLTVQKVRDSSTKFNNVDNVTISDGIKIFIHNRGDSGDDILVDFLGWWESYMRIRYD